MAPVADLRGWWPVSVLANFGFMSFRVEWARKERREVRASRCPPNFSPYHYNGVVYQQCASTGYPPQYVSNQVHQYVVINQPY